MSRIRLIAVILIGLFIFTSQSSFSQTNDESEIIKLQESVEKRSDIAKSKEYETIIRYYLQTNPQKAIEVCHSWIEKAKKLNDPLAEVDALTTLSKTNIMLSNYKEADSISQKAIEICKKSKNQNGLGSQYGNLGVIAEMTGNNPLAVKYYLSADSIFSLTKNIKSLSFIENNLGIVFNNMKLFDKSLHYYQSAYAHKTELKDSLGAASTLVNIGMLYESLKTDNDKALYYYGKAKILYDKFGLSPQQAVIYNNIGLIYLHKNNLSDAKVYLEKALQMRQELQDKYGMASTKLNLASLAQQEKDYKKSILYASESVGIFSTANIKPKLAECYKVLSESYEKTGQKDSALANLKNYIALNDSILNEANLNTVQELEARYQNDVNLKKITILQQKNRITKLGIFSLTLGLLALAVIGFFIFRQRRLQQENKQLAIEQKLLRSQLNPHFIFNAIGSIQSYMYRNDAKSASSYLAKFASLMRAILEQSSQDVSPLSEEIQMLENYLSLEQLRKNNAFQYQILTENDIDTEETMLPSMLVQPFVENAIKHAFKTELEENNIIIHFSKKDKTLQVQIEDNGVGINETLKQEKTHKSMASEIFKHRMKILGKKWENAAHFSIVDLSEVGEKGTRVIFSIPLSN